MVKGLSHERVGRFEVVIRKSGDMLTSPVIFASGKIWDALEDDALSQLADAARLPGVARVFGTPDLHVGYGVPIGCVTAMRDAVIPAAVGYDVNCGMRLMTTPRAACDVDLDALAHSVARDVPLGEGRHNVRVSKTDLDKILEGGLSALPEIERSDHRAWEGWEDAETERDMAHSEDSGSMKGDPAAVSTRAKQRGISQFGTLGGGKYDTDGDGDCDVNDLYKKWDSREPLNDLYETWEPVNQDFEYTGRRFDDESETQESRARQLDLLTGQRRFARAFWIRFRTTVSFPTTRWGIAGFSEALTARRQGSWTPGR